MAPPSRSSASWERVLAAVEADAARAAALLTSDDASASAGIEFDKYDAVVAAPADDVTGVPATWRLPVPASGSAAGGPGLTGGAAARAVAGYAAATGGAPAPGAAQGGAPSTGPSSAGIAAEQTADIDSVQLPDPGDMPPMTSEQQERFTALHTRITELQGQLAAAMAEAESVLARPPIRRPDPQPRPELVDRRL